MLTGSSLVDFLILCTSDGVSLYDKQCSVVLLDLLLWTPVAVS